MVNLRKIVLGTLTAGAIGTCIYVMTNHDMPDDRKAGVGVGFAIIASIGTYFLFKKNPTSTNRNQSLTTRQNPDNPIYINNQSHHIDLSDRRQIHNHTHHHYPPR